MNELKLVFQQTLWGEVVREARYDQITHFTSGDKYTTAHYGEGQELVFLATLKTLQATFADLMHTHRSVLVKTNLISQLRHDKSTGRYFVLLEGGQRVPVSRSCYMPLRELINERKWS